MYKKTDFIDFDEIYRKTGSYGRYQMKIMLQIFLNNFPVGFNIMVLIFQIHDIPFTCRSLPNDSIMEIGPNSTVQYESCSVKISNETNGTDNQIIPCPNGYEYEQEKHHSVRSQWDLVCADEPLADLSITIYSAGKLAGCFILPNSADRYGRKPIIVLANFAMCVLNIIIIFSPSYVFFLIVKGLTGFFQPGVSIPGAVLLLELFPTECRTHTQVVFGITWGVVLMLLCPVSYFTEPYGWRCLNALVALSSCGFLFHIWTLHESLRWQAQSGKVKEANATLKHMCKVNKIDYSEVESLMANLNSKKPAEDIEVTSLDEISSTDSSDETYGDEHSDEIYNIKSSEPVPSETKNGMLQKKHKDPNYSKYPRIIIVLITPCLRKILSIMFCLFFVCSLTYYGLYLMTTRLSGNRFLNFFISALFETLSQIFAFSVFKRFSRKSCCIGCLSFTGIVLIIAVLLRTFSDSDIALLASTGFSFLGTFGISAAFLLVGIYVTELFPTDVRNVGSALASIASRLGQIIAPFVRFLSKLVPWAPGITFGVICLLMNILIRFLPETLNKQLPQTVEDAKIRDREEMKRRIAKKKIKKQKH
ncbi:organic cation transporter protein-like isoform X1 [Octopus sinensis]|uniref:Organic cation transporter protein-like isoform X1 n=1 Tax=Octopus sinensis TaxID=2607531 RepID=A0A6P7SZC2_9MOLL|nr:organic cation transporter protein-like isoform X1 [Octopus sinensis]